MERVYLYGIIDTGTGGALDTPVFAGATPPCVIGHDGVGCLVSRYQGDPFETLSREELIRRLLGHQQVLEAAMQQSHTVIPLKFGTMLTTQEEVHRLLVQGQPQFAQTLAFIRDKVEVEVAATWDTAQVFKEVGKEEEVALTLQAINRVGHPTLEQRVQLGERVKASLDRRREGYSTRMALSLGPLATDMTPNPLLSDEMVMNVAFLLEQGRLPAFERAVHRLDGLFKNELLFRMVGPLPPYSFTIVEVRRITQEQVSEAQGTLGLSEAISEKGVRKSYRGLAAQAQRRLEQGDMAARDQLARLRRASDLLLHSSRMGKREAEGLPSRDTGCLFAIAIKRSEQAEVQPARFGGPGRT